MNPSNRRSPMAHMMLGIHPDDTERYDAVMDALSPRKRARGQPRKAPQQTNDAKRALLLYMVAERIRRLDGLNRDHPLRIQMRTHLRLARVLFPDHPLLAKPSSPNKMLSSVKRGRKIWGIDDRWRGRPVEDLLGVPF